MFIAHNKHTVRHLILRLLPHSQILNQPIRLFKPRRMLRNPVKQALCGVFPLGFLHFDSLVPNAANAQPPQKLVMRTLVWLKNLSENVSEHSPEKEALGIPKVETSGLVLES